MHVHLKKPIFVVIRKNVVPVRFGGVRGATVSNSDAAPPPRFVHASQYYDNNDYYYYHNNHYHFERSIFPNSSRAQKKSYVPVKKSSVYETRPPTVARARLFVCSFEFTWFSFRPVFRAEQIVTLIEYARRVWSMQIGCITF